MPHGGPPCIAAEAADIVDLDEPQPAACELIASPPPRLVRAALRAGLSMRGANFFKLAREDDSAFPKDHAPGAAGGGKCCVGCMTAAGSALLFTGFVLLQIAWMMENPLNGPKPATAAWPSSPQSPSPSRSPPPPPPFARSSLQPNAKSQLSNEIFRPPPSANVAQRVAPRIARAPPKPAPPSCAVAKTVCLADLKVQGLDLFEPDIPTTTTFQIGIWGGECTCPNGLVYPVGDEGNFCHSLACHGGEAGKCHREEGPWAHHTVTCGKPLPGYMLQIFNPGNARKLVAPPTLINANSDTMACLEGAQLDWCSTASYPYCFRLSSKSNASFSLTSCVKLQFLYRDALPAGRQVVEFDQNAKLSFSMMRLYESPPPMQPSPPSPPLPPSPPPRSPPSPWPPTTSKLSVATCDLAFSNPRHLFRQMWDREARTQLSVGGHACWDYARDCAEDDCPVIDADKYWTEARAGSHCDDDWYAGSGEFHGWFNQPAPALLGFDGDIHRVCFDNCDAANYNILQLFSDEIRYNLCRNFEWQLCAAQGKLPGQSGKYIEFAVAPKDLDFMGNPPFGCCSGWTDRYCEIHEAFSNDDIFYMEVCIFSQICSNRESLFEIEAEMGWHCILDDGAYKRLMGLLREGPKPGGPLGGKCG